jgi:hypothetical protein
VRPAPGPHPEPPADFDTRPLPIVPFAGTTYRIERRGPRTVRFRRSAFRFNAPADEFGVLYLSTSLEGAFVESFGWATGSNVVSVEALVSRELFEVELSAVTLVDLTGPGLSRIGADDRLCKGDDYGLAQRWALAIHNHPSAPDGILYGARHDPACRSIALFDRAATHVVGVQRAATQFLASAILPGLLDRYGFGLIGDARVLRQSQADLR